jgi:hypothetical protein
MICEPKGYIAEMIKIAERLVRIRRSSEVLEHQKSWTFLNSGYYPSSCLLFKACSFGDWFLSRLQMEPTEVGPIEIASLCLWRLNPVYETWCFK